MIVAVKGKRYDIPRGYVLVEWVGEGSPLDHEWVRYKRTVGLFSREQNAVIDYLAKWANRFILGHTRTMEPGTAPHQIGGLSQKYTWGHPRHHRVAPGQPGSYVQLLTARDADLILQTRNGHEFRVYDNAGETAAPDERMLLLPPQDVEVRLTREARLIVGKGLV